MNDDIVKESKQSEDTTTERERGSTEASRPNVPTELEKLQKQAEEYLNGWKRAQADFVNYKKDEAKRLEEFVKFANVSLVMEVIELLDDLETAAKEIKNVGLDQVIKKFQELLKKYEVERIKTDGNFDPALHEAVSTEDGGDKIEEVRAGYTMQGRVIRPTRVKVVK